MAEYGNRELGIIQDALQEIYEDLKEKVSGFSEHDIEREESITHLKRSIVQCIRDVRQSGKITKGEQEYMEQIGVNPSKMQRIIQEYVKKEVEQNSWGSEGLFEFVDGAPLTTKYASPITSILCKPHLANISSNALNIPFKKC